jgi:4'-phosphopantetheinyl transferase
MPQSLDRNEVHLFYAWTEWMDDDARRSAFLTLLSEEEKVRHQRFLFEPSRREFLLTRALVRTLLSRYADGVGPAEWRFVQNAYGRPELASPQLPFKLCFNLSNTQGLVACAVCVDRSVGVDVENVSRATSGLHLAQRFFSPDEVHALKALPESAQRERFFVYWTLKEAYIKARGMGLAIPLRQFSFHPASEREWSIAFHPPLVDPEEAWQFTLEKPSPLHQLALAVALRRGESVRVSMGAASWLTA